MDLLGGCGEVHTPPSPGQVGAGGVLFSWKSRKIWETWNTRYSDDMSYSIWVSCMIFSLLLIVLALRMYNHVFIMKNYACILKGRWHTWLRLTQFKYLMNNPPTRAGRTPPLPDHAGSTPALNIYKIRVSQRSLTLDKLPYWENPVLKFWILFSGMKKLHNYLNSCRTHSYS